MSAAPLYSVRFVRTMGSIEHRVESPAGCAEAVFYGGRNAPNAQAFADLLNKTRCTQQPMTRAEEAAQAVIRG